MTPTIVNSDGNFTIVSHRLSTSVRSGIAAIQIVEIPKVAEEGELVINVSGDTTYTVSENATYTTVYVTGVGTLSFSGEGTITTTTLNIGNGVTVPASSSQLTFTTATGSGTIVYDGAQPSTTLGFDNSDNWFGTVWVKNIGASGEGEGSTKTSVTLGDENSTATANSMNNWGNSNSFVKFTNVRAHLNKLAAAWTLVLEDDGANYAWYCNNGWTDQNGNCNTVFAALKGDGTFYDAGNNGCRQKISFADASDFTGTLNVNAKCICLGGTSTPSTLPNAEANRGTIEIPVGATITVPTGKTWTTSLGGFRVNGTLNVNGTLASASTVNAILGSGTVVFTGRAPTPLDGENETKWWKNANWTGTVELNAATTIAGWEFNNYGHSGSTLRLNNCSGWLKSNYTCIPALEIGGTFTWNDGSSGLNSTFKVGTLKGSGTISIPTGGAPTAVWQITDDWSGFTGAVVGNNTDGRRVLVFGLTLPATVEAGEIYISADATLNLGNASAMWWTLGKGFVVDGTVVSPNRDKWGGGTAMTLGDNGILELTSTSNTEDSGNYSSVIGTGTIKYSSTAGWRTFPSDDTKMPATTLTVQVELVDSLIITKNNNGTTTIGNLAGSKNIRSDWSSVSGGANGRTLTVTQSKDTEWQGKFVSNRITQFNVNPGASATGTLTLSGTQTETVPAAINGSVNLTGTWKGNTTVSGTFGGTGTLTGNLTFNADSTFKAFDSDENGLAVSGSVEFPTTGDEPVAVDLSGITLSGSGTTLITTTGGTINDISKLSVSGAVLARENEGKVLKAYPNYTVTTTDGVTTGYSDLNTAIVAAYSAAFNGTLDYLTVYASDSITITPYTESMKIKNAGGATITLDLSAEYSQTISTDGDYTIYSSTIAPTTYTWTDEWNDSYNTGDHDWGMYSNWSYVNNSSEAVTATRVPVAGDTVVFNDGATVTLDANAACAAMTVNGAVSISGAYDLAVSGNITGGTGTPVLSLEGVNLSLSASSTVSGISFVLADGATLVVPSSVTLSPTPTTNVARSRVKTVTSSGTTTYSVEAIPGTTFTVY